MILKKEFKLPWIHPPFFILLLGGLKFLIFVILLGWVLLLHSLVDLILKNEKMKLNFFLLSIKYASHLGLKILNVKVKNEGQKHKAQGQLIVANHLSYLDVLILFAQSPSLFVTSVEIKETFLLGKVCRLAGCFFVERRRSHRTSQTKLRELSSMKEKLHDGFDVFLFPEGTSSDGREVLPFKVTFFQLAVETNSSVKPMCLKYTGDNAHIPPWHGNMTFADHLFRLCSQLKINAVVSFLDEVYGTEKTELARQTYRAISNEYSKY